MIYRTLSLQRKRSFYFFSRGNEKERGVFRISILKQLRKLLLTHILSKIIFRGLKKWNGGRIGRVLAV
ncbi:hypothetical protein LEP1GSC036_4304 [Leptospira weilii str. 2006001853]|uniref:Uncharacterized protein n=2 Tax=Leptospira weilii TaxID=28184 RepID=A0A828YZS0_9LEPT|nr:hypothetical protein LEP1GSC036_4304 [Leptospira weilii str. 2006001853]EMJ65292.1 hypothetical protein LEP1GSC051_4021 [Leptospira sp. P2653]EMM72137.1 hypothetical protein LEP1GSC038_3853 [Leptospira weilii str. 2006001855]QDK24210.1 hypothetical protein FHG67_16895 [Leptospira weilii]QDK28171.1 hypothetical protein FHG68_16940 [Leptospira weilii]